MLLQTNELGSVITDLPQFVILLRTLKMNYRFSLFFLHYFLHKVALNNMRGANSSPIGDAS